MDSHQVLAAVQGSAERCHELRSGSVAEVGCVVPVDPAEGGSSTFSTVSQGPLGGRAADQFGLVVAVDGLSERWPWRSHVNCDPGVAVTPQALQPGGSSSMLRGSPSQVMTNVADPVPFWIST